MKTHELKSWPQFFEPVLTGKKRFEIRNDDRGFEVGDILKLKEYIPDEDCYTGRELEAKVTYLMPAFPALGLMAGYCIMSINVLKISKVGAR